MVVNLWGIDKYDSKHTVSHKNVQENIGGMYELIITVGLYIQEVKDMRRQIFEDSIFE